MSNELAQALGLPSFKLELTFDEAGTVYAAMMLAATRIRNEEGGKEYADQIETIAKRLLPNGDAAMYSVNLDAASDNNAADMSLTVDDAADIYAALMTVSFFAHSADDHDTEHRLQGLAEKFLNASAANGD